MKLLLPPIFLLVFSFYGHAQVDYYEEESFLIGSLEITPSLSVLSPEIPLGNFTIREADIFKKETKREVDMLAMMERKKNYRTRKVDLSQVFPKRQNSEGTGLHFSNNTHHTNRASNYDSYTGKTKNPAYRELQNGFFDPGNSPFRRSNYFRPYHYSPFFR